jgi:signal peptidase I
LFVGVLLPFVAKTSVYPVAVVDGNSMYPNLQNGALVFFSAPNGPIQNGTVIVFVQARSGVPALDSFLEPVVIHRVIGTGVEPNGVPYYQTKGDNNQAPDPFYTDSPNVLGVPYLVIPYAGLPILFGKSPYGMVSIVAMFSLYFFSGIDSKFDEAAQRKRLIAVFARLSLNGEISPGQFERLKLAIEYHDDLDIGQLMDPTILSAVDWLKGGVLERDWKEGHDVCQRCGNRAVSLTCDDKILLMCPKCSERGYRGDNITSAP